MLRVEFHCHTIFSKDSLTRPEALLRACRQKKLDRVIVTDHNTTAGAFACQALDPQRVIIGEEIMTSEGELLAAFMQEEIPPGLSPEETIKLLRSQGAFISVSHPFDAQREGAWGLNALERILPLVDSIETFNARCMSNHYNELARAFAYNNHISGTVGSDAHTIIELGTATLILPLFNSAASLKAALPQARAELKLSSPLIHFTSRYAVLVKKFARALGIPLANQSGRVK